MPNRQALIVGFLVLGFGLCKKGAVISRGEGCARRGCCAVLPLPGCGGGTSFSAGHAGFWHGGSFPACRSGSGWWAAVCPLASGDNHRSYLETCLAEFILTRGGNSGRSDLCLLQWFPKTAFGNPSFSLCHIKMGLTKGLCFRTT